MSDMIKSAFPVPDMAMSKGMTLRDWFAGQAMISLLRLGWSKDELAQEAYRIADQLIAVKNKTEQVKGVEHGPVSKLCQETSESGDGNPRGGSTPRVS